MTSRVPALSNSIERGSVRPVATRAAWYPEAMEGFIEFVGVSVVGQLEDWPKAGTTKKPSKAAKDIGDILRDNRARRQVLQRYSNREKKMYDMSKSRMVIGTVQSGD